MELQLIATTAFGLEGVAARELSWLGVENARTENGRVRFTGDFNTVARANLWLRTADRVLISLAEGEVHTFDELFQLVRRIPWENFLPENACFPVTGKSVKSVLHSVPDCQAITKKAIVERLKQSYPVDWFPEDGPLFKIEVSILNDYAMITLDTSGAGLHKRGYRKDSIKAPIKETLAAGMLLISHWKKDRALLDPFCGSGTIPIEAAMIARNIAPGLQRTFLYETWPCVPKGTRETAQKEAESKIDYDITLRISASDIDYFAVKQAKENAQIAGVLDDITFQKLDFKATSSHYKYGSIVTNPPYGERLMEEKEAARLYKDMGAHFKHFDTWSVYLITSFEKFETCYGSKAHKKRKLYNGMLKCNLYQYFGPKPPRQPIASGIANEAEE